MRWDNLRLDDQGLDTELAADQDTAGGDTLFPPARRDVAVPLIERGAVARTFTTPGFRGMTFFEVQAKSVVNRVPESSRMSFRWTINPYRGCQHACRYCQSGDTPILMADGRTKQLAAVRAGDEIYGTVQARHPPPVRGHHGAGALVHGQARLPGRAGRRHPVRVPAVIIVS